MEETEAVKQITSEQIWQLIIALLIPLVIIPIATWLRRQIWVFGYFSKESKHNALISCLKNIANYLAAKWGFFILGEILAMFLYITVVIPIILGTEYLIQSMAFAAAIVVFLTFQLPRLLSPNVSITLLPYNENTSYMPISKLNKPIRELQISRNTKCHIFTYITNLGINSYEKCGCWLAFEKPITIVQGQELEQEYNRRNWFTQKLPLYHAENNSLAFEHTEALNFGPGDNLIRKAYIRTPNETGRYYLDVEVTSSTRWGSTVKRFYLNVT